MLQILHVYVLLNVLIYIIIALDKYIDDHVCIRATNVTSKFAADSSSLIFSFCPSIYVLNVYSM